MGFNSGFKGLRREEVEVLNEIYLAVTLDSTVVWPKHGYSKRKSDLVAVDKCLVSSPDMKINIIEDV